VFLVAMCFAALPAYRYAARLHAEPEEHVAEGVGEIQSQRA
jgi:hypothetical protein